MADGPLPTNIEDAVTQILLELPPEAKEQIRTSDASQLIQFHFGLGMWIRNRFGLWKENEALIRSACNGESATQTTLR